MTYPSVILGEVLELLIDNRGKNPPYSPDGVAVVSGMSVGQGRLDVSGSRHVSLETWAQWMPKPTQRNDVILTSEAPLGRVALVGSNEPLVLAQRVFGLRGRQGLLDSRFLYYAFQTVQVQADLQGRATGTTVTGIRQPALLQVRIPAPSFEEQRAIAKVLGTLDDKIAANTKLAEGATRLAVEYFNLTCEGEDTAWVPLGSVATTVLGGTPRRDIAEYWSGGTVAWVNSGKANEERIVTPSEYITEEALSSSAAKVMPIGATLIAITGATMGQVARLEIEAAGNQSLIGIWAKDSPLNDWLYFAIRSRIPELLTRATGAAQQHVNKRDADALKMPLVSRAALTEFAADVSPLLKAAALCDRQNMTLAATRDALLPQLMSGRLRVRDAENVLEGVL